MKLTEQRSSMLHGVLLITLFACAAFYIGDMGWVKALFVESDGCWYYLGYALRQQSSQ